MNSPLYDAIIKYKKNITSFHMPGHKFGTALDMNKIPLIDLDVTEVPGLDNLYNAEGIILEAQRKMADKYGAKDTIFLTNGSTSGIIASILTICKPGDSLIVAKNCHHSVWNGLILAGVRPIYINPTFNDTFSIMGGICPLKLKQIIQANPDVRGVVLVSPTYEGLVSDMEQIANIVHKYNKVLIVDEAHGAHFTWDKNFPKSSLQHGADIVIHSMHKTLPLLTQSALMHIGSHRVHKNDIIRSLQMIQTSSPSYIMMALMDYMRSYMDEYKEVLWGNYIKQLDEARKKLKQLKNLYILSEEILGHYNIYDIDKSKIVIFTKETNITGIELGSILSNKYNIQVEVESQEYIIAMSTIGDTKSSLDKLCNALLEIDLNLKTIKTEKQKVDRMHINTQGIATPRDIYFSSKTYVPIEDSEGMVSATNIMEYPPGVPIICIGEIFSKDMIQYIRTNKSNLLGIQIKDNCIQVEIVKYN